MKILKLRFKNINSFKGPHDIDFTIPPLSIAGLFAITGPTGAGKSTILDIITLALFNRIPRFDGKITSSEIENLGSVITHFTDEAYAEVEYQSGQEAFRSTWKISKTRKNTLKDYEMSLSHLHDGTILDLKKSEVPGENERIIGLNYDQFIRSILLSQGEFAKFLKSDKAERTSLLEEITGSKIYRALGKATYEKSKLKKEEILQLKQQIEAIPVLCQEEIIEKQNKLIDNKNSITQIDTILNVNTNLLTQLDKKSQLEKKLIEAKELQEVLIQKKTEFQLKEVKLQKHKKINIHSTEITLWTHENTMIEEQESEITSCKQKIGFNEKLLHDSIEEMKTFTNQEINESNFLSEIKKFENNIINFDNQLNIIKERGIKIRSDYNKLLLENSHSFGEKLQNFNNIDQKIQYCNDTITKLESRNKISAKDDTIREEAASMQQNLISLEKKHFEAMSYEHAKRDLVSLSSEKILALSQKEKQAEANIANQSTINELLPKIDNLRIKKEEQFKFYSLEEHRKMLKDHEPCPLCGSTNHPYSLEKELVNLGQIEAQIMYLNAELSLTQKEEISISASLSSVVSRLEFLDQQIDFKKNQIHTLDADNQEFKLSSTIASDIKTLSEKTKSDLVILQNEIDARINFTFFMNCLELLKELNESSSTYIKINDQRKNMYAGQDISGDIEKLQYKYISARDSCKESKVTLNNALENYKKLAKIHTDRENNLIQSLNKLGYEGIKPAISELLNDIEYQEISKEKEDLIKRDTECTNNLDTLQTDLGTISIPEGSESDPTILQKTILQLHNDKDSLNHANGSLTNELNKNEAAFQKIKESEIVLNKKTEDASVWFIMDKLIGDATGSKYARYAQNLSLRHLIDLANKRLSKLTDRYLLVYTDIETDLTITDLYQGSIKRSVKTLSGGESFIVSLALALSLADMASQNVKLESLFIDEGFGTLDTETLETAIETLERLQSESNRTIGIISHVESLKERITTQIRVNKNTGGYATVEVMG